VVVVVVVPLEVVEDLDEAVSAPPEEAVIEVAFEDEAEAATHHTEDIKTGA
jgi:hypothetical protein